MEGNYRSRQGSAEPVTSHPGFDFQTADGKIMTSLDDRKLAYVGLAARILFAALFMLSGLMKLSNMEGTAKFMATKGVPVVQVLLLLTIVIEVLASLAIAAGAHARAAALVLFMWLVPVTLVFHPFWAVDAAQKQIQLTQFMKNLAIMGGALLLVVNGAGALSIDGRRRRQAAS